MPVSALEKNAERMIRAVRIENSKPSGASFKAGMDLLSDVGFYLEEKAESGQDWWQGLYSGLSPVQY